PRPRVGAQLGSHHQDFHRPRVARPTSPVGGNRRPMRSWHDFLGANAGESRVGCAPMDSLVAKAAILQEALPYIRRFHNQTVVVKYGGHAMVDPELEASFARDVCLLRYVGIRVLVVHGGGPQINDTLMRLGIQSTFSAGLRVTDDATMDVVEMVLAGRVNSQIVGLLGAQGGRAIGLSGRDDSLLLAERLGAMPQPGQAADAPLVDLGRVGRITRVK